MGLGQRKLEPYCSVCYDTYVCKLPREFPINNSQWKRWEFVGEVL